MAMLDTCSLKKSLPLLLTLLVIAQVDLASAFDWPPSLLSFFHLSAASNDQCRGCLAGVGASIDLLALFQLARIFVKRAMQPRHE